MNGGGRCDVLVAGGGLAGGLAALALARLGLDVTLVEAREPTPAKDTADNRDGRSISLSLASLRVLEALGATGAFGADSQAITSVHISEAGRYGRLCFAAREMGVEALGRVVPADPLLAAIMRAAGAAGVERISPAKVESAGLADGGAFRTAILSGPNDGSTIDARLVLVADGAGSALREALGIGHSTQRYRHTALVTTARVDSPRAGVAYERFTRDGTLAILPRAGERVGVVWTVPEERAEALAALPAEAYLGRVAEALGHRLGEMHPAAPLRQFLLSATHARSQTAPRAVIIGNAAHSLHPVAAQGFNLSVRDIAVLAECLAGQSDPGDAGTLKCYAERRRRDQARTRAYTGFVRMLGDLQMPLASPFRALGLLAAEFNRPLARALARQGMGLAPRPLPGLVRGQSL